MLAITHTNIILPDHLIPDGTILMDGEYIVDFGMADEVTIPKEAAVIDAGGDYAGPGLIDIHTHAGGRSWFHEDPVSAAEHHLAHGTTSLLPALYFNLDKKQYIESIERVREASKSSVSGSIIRGLYMEGPYLNPKYGADQDNHKWVQGPVKDDYKDLVASAGDFAKVWCVAPELEGVLDFVKFTKQKIDGIVFSVAHSEASPEQIEQCIPYGLHLATHHTNATGNLDKYPECRGVSVDETVNFHDDIYAELICDAMGIHVDPYMLRLILKIKGKDKVILISDACVFDGPTPPGLEGAFDLNFDDAGQIAGSKLTLDVACRNMMKHTGSSLSDIFTFASLNPARLLGMPEYGQIRKGNRADIVLVDHQMNIRQVILSGKPVGSN